MEAQHIEILREAVETRRRKESLEQAVGRVARKRELDFSDYVGIMSEVRERALAEKKTVDEAARVLLRKHGEDAE